jgi:NADH dehydrogenase/NADH:ubiquinone oxidoreductase subunit G
VAIRGISLRIDGKRRRAAEGQTILEVARAEGIEIPTLCYHDSLEPAGSCRLCMVEVKQGSRTRTMAACVTPVAGGMVVRTDTERIRRIRRVLMSLLLARCPEVETIRRMARRMGVRRVPYARGESDCFLCGMCVRACEEIVGIGAIGFINRGVEMEVGAPFGLESSVCIGCGTCTTICEARSFSLDKVFPGRDERKGG